MKKFLIALCYSLVVSNQTVVQGQDSVAASHLSQYLASRPIERLYVHHDRNAYRAGETVWIKVYQAISPQAPEASRVAYIDLADSKGNIVSQAKLSLDDGTASGQFTLPDNLPTGEYSLCAYTRWMLNFPPEGIFHRTLTIYGHSPQNAPSSLSKEAETGILLRFFPEGGDLIEGIPSKVAFEAIDTQGKEHEVSGYILDDTGDSIQQFKTTHRGKGTFFFQPQPGKQYKAYLHGSPTPYPLPERQAHGFVLTAKILPDAARITLRNNLTTETDRHIYTLTLHQEGTVIAQWPVSADKAYQYFDLPVKQLPTGIFRLTLTDETLRAYCERQLFVRFPETASLQLAADCRQEEGRKKLTINLQGKDGKPLPQNGSFSIAVVKAETEHANDRNDLCTYLFIDSQLQGSIAPAATYWQPDESKSLSRIDLLLLTHGWCRYTLAEAAQPATPPTYVMEQGLTLTGKVNRLNAKQYGQASLTALLEQDSTRQVLTCPIDNEKRFCLLSPPFYGERQVLLSAHNGEGKALPILLDSPQPTVPPLHAETEPRASLSLAPSFSPIPTDEEMIALDEVQITARKKDPMEKVRPYGGGFVQSSMDVKEEQAHGDVRQLLRRMPGVTLISNPDKRKGGNLMYAHINGMPAQTTATLVLDGYVVRDMEAVYSMEAARISHIEVLKQTNTQFGGFIKGGVIALYTHPSRSIEVKSEQLLHTWKGFSQAKEFYTPVPGDNAFFDKPHARNCVYWNPKVTIAPTGNATFSFYLNERETGSYMVHCEGYSGEGKAGATTLEIAVLE